MTKPQTVTILENTYFEYIKARQARYDELCEMIGRQPHPCDAFDMHFRLVEMIDDEKMGNGYTEFICTNSEGMPEIDI